jgi:uncharacterized protein (DUF2147 family)
MQRQDDGTWRGRAFVPDMNMTFTGFAQPLSHETLKIKGCLIRNLFCRSQVWTRVG